MSSIKTTTIGDGFLLVDVTLVPTELHLCTTCLKLRELREFSGQLVHQSYTRLSMSGMHLAYALHPN